MSLQENLFFLRHLESENNKLGIISGQSNPKISFKNITIVSSMDFRKIYCSPSKRCRETIESLENKETSKIVINNDLSERNMGKLEGHKKSDMLQEYPSLFHNKVFDLFATPPEGESYQDFYKRVNFFYKQYLIRDLKEKTLICSHNQTLKLLRLLLLQKEINYNTWEEYNFPNGQVVALC